MSGLFFIDSIRLWLRRRNREKRLLSAQAWPIANGEVNHWEILGADAEASSVGALYQIEGRFHFLVNSDYFGGYLHSVALPHREAETLAKGNPTVYVRYDPANPDSVAVLAEDNENNLPFRILSD
jgi:hypothetical protein